MAVTSKPIPSAEGKFDAWVRQFVAQVSGHPAEYKIGDDRVSALEKLLAEWETDYAASTAARDAARAAISKKDTTRNALTEEARVAVRLIQANNSVTDAARRDAGVPVHKTTRTPVGIPTTEVLGFVMSSDRLEHTLSFHDSATPTRRARPNGVTGCEVYLHVGDAAPQDPAEYRFLKLATRTPDRIAFDSADAGKLANYLLRWVNTKGEHGPWSQVISATIPAV